MRIGLTVLVVLLGAALVAAGCTAGEEPDERVRVGWQQLEVPDGLTPVLAVGTDRGLLVGAEDPEAPSRPRMLLLSDGTWSTVPVEGSTYYGRLGRWRSIAVRGDRIVAFASQPGGAHFNPRWTTWEGTFDRLVERPQPYTTFGGWDAGAIQQVVFVGEPVVVGSWAGEDVGLDIALWSLHGHAWVRRSSAGTALASERAAIPSVRDAAVRGGHDLVLVGSVTKADAGVQLRPSWWQGGSPPRSWRRAALPSLASGEALAVGCMGERCLAGGHGDGRLALWRITDEATEIEAAPDLAVRSTSPMVVAPDAAHLLVGSDEGSTLVAETEEGWATGPGPPGSPTSWAQVADTAYVTTTDAGGRLALWAAGVPR
jgi:hypothetical protein